MLTLTHPVAAALELAPIVIVTGFVDDLPVPFVRVSWPLTELPDERPLVLVSDRPPVHDSLPSWCWPHVAEVTLDEAPLVAPTGPEGLLELASMTGVTRSLIRALLPSLDAVAAFDWLAAQPYVDRSGEGLTLPPRVAALVHSASNPALEADLRRALADHLHLRARAGATRCAAYLAAVGASPAEPVEADVREALRSFHERSESERALLLRGIEAAFGDSPRQRRRRDVLMSAYIDRHGSLEDAADALGMSRTTYFRQLAKAVAALQSSLSAAASAAQPVAISL